MSFVRGGNQCCFHDVQKLGDFNEETVVEALHRNYSDEECEQMLSEVSDFLNINGETEFVTGLSKYFLCLEKPELSFGLLIRPKWEQTYISDYKMNEKYLCSVWFANKSDWTP